MREGIFSRRCGQIEVAKESFVCNGHSAELRHARTFIAALPSLDLFLTRLFRACGLFERQASGLARPAEHIGLNKSFGLRPGCHLALPRNVTSAIARIIIGHHGDSTLPRVKFKIHRAYCANYPAPRD